MEQSTTFREKFSLKSWKTRDILVLVMISLVLALITFAGAWVRTSLEAAIGVFGNRIVSPLIIVIVYTGAYIVRRPLAAIISALVMGLVSSPFLPAGLATIFGYLIGGILVEISFAIGGYRNYSLPFMLACGLVYNLIGIGLIWVPFRLGALSPLALGGVVIITVVTGLIGGWLTKAIGDAVMQSGVMTQNAELTS
ncbi:MAG: ECF transporter S component [Chloroflexota bacterium]